jgi:hypothetical protein
VGRVGEKKKKGAHLICLLKRKSFMRFSGANNLRMTRKASPATDSPQGACSFDETLEYETMMESAIIHTNTTVWQTSKEPCFLFSHLAFAVEEKVGPKGEVAWVGRKAKQEAFSVIPTGRRLYMHMA